MADKPSNRDRQQDDSPNPFKPARLASAKLNQEQAKPVASTDVHAREMPLVSFGDHSNPAAPVSERPHSFAPLDEVQPQLRQEQSRVVQLRAITVTPVQMQELRERRVEARELGWTVPGHRIRIEAL